MSKLVLVLRDNDAVARITLNRANKRNALNIPLLEELCAAIDEVNADPQVRIIVLQGKGPVFCAGMDLKEATETEHSHRSAALLAHTLESIYTSPKLTIAKVQGAAVAGGAGLMSICDLAIAADNAKLGYPEVKRGLVAGLVMTFLRRQLNERHARELLLLGEVIDAQRAAEIGLVTRVAPEADLEAELERAITEGLKNSPNAVRLTKHLFHELWPSPLSVDIERALDLHKTVRDSEDAQEGMRAFFEKRPPSWQ